MIRALLLAAALLAAPTLADERTDRLDTLHAALLAAPDMARAQALEDEVWRIWTTAPDAEAQALLDRAFIARQRGDYTAAHAALDVLIAGWPDYAEGWNQRATLLFLAARYGESLDAVDETLIREPRHFGALAGRAVVLLRMGREADARRSLRAALSVNPWLREAALFPPEE